MPPTLRALLRRPLRPGLQHRIIQRPPLRPSSTHQSSPSPPPSSSSSSPPSSQRVSKLLSRLPPRLRKHASFLLTAPVSHGTAFLILHELTAVVPLVALAALFHYYLDVAPVEAWMRGHYGSYVSQGLERFERYFRRKGWFGFGAEGKTGEQRDARGESEGGLEVVNGEGEADGQPRYKVVVEVALAYAITKALLPLRIVGSVWATPWFAGVLVRLRSLVRPAR